MAEFTGKVAIVMGASTAGGMGEATARRLAREGAKVVVSGLEGDHLEALAKEIGGLSFVADISAQSQVKALVDYTISAFGELHLAVNLAGYCVNCPIRDITEDHLLKMTAVNYFGTVWFIQQVANQIVDGGAIVTISSLSGFDMMPGISAYASAKRAAVRFVEVAAVEYRAKRLRINAIIPSANDTNMFRKGIAEFGGDVAAAAQAFVDLTPLGRLSRPDDIAAMVVMLMRDDYFETGQALNCTGGNALLGHPRGIA